MKDITKQELIKFLEEGNLISDYIIGEYVVFFYRDYNFQYHALDIKIPGYNIFYYKTYSDVWDIKNDEKLIINELNYFHDNDLSLGIINEKFDPTEVGSRYFALSLL